MASQKAGDRSGADASRARLTKIYVRDPVYLYMRSNLNRMTPKATNSWTGHQAQSDDSVVGDDSPGPRPL